MTTMQVQFQAIEADVTAQKIAEAMDHLEHLPPSRERSIVQTKLDEAAMWLTRAHPAENEKDGTS